MLYTSDQDVGDQTCSGDRISSKDHTLMWYLPEIPTEPPCLHQRPNYTDEDIFALSTIVEFIRPTYTQYGGYGNASGKKVVR